MGSCNNEAIWIFSTSGHHYPNFNHTTFFTLYQGSLSEESYSSRSYNRRPRLLQHVGKHHHDFQGLLPSTTLLPSTPLLPSMPTTPTKQYRLLFHTEACNTPAAISIARKRLCNLTGQEAGDTQSPTSRKRIRALSADTLAYMRGIKRLVDRVDDVEKVVFARLPLTIPSFIFSDVS